MSARTEPPGAWRARARELFEQREVRLLSLIVLLALALRTAWVLYAARAPQGLHDQFFYLFYAEQIARGHGYRLLDGTPTAYFPIGYPGTLSAVFALVIHTPIPDNLVRSAAYFQVVIGAATVVPVYVVGRRLFDGAVGLLAALWVALFPNLIFHTGTYLSETLFNFATMCALAVIVWPRWEGGRVGQWRLGAFGVLLGYSALVRPISLLFVPALAMAWLLCDAGWRRALGQAGLVLLAAGAVIAPWSIRNAVVMKSPILISSNLGDDLCIGNHPGASGHFELPDYCFGEGLRGGGGSLEVHRNNVDTRKALSFAVQHPVFEVRLLWRKAYWLVQHDHDGIAGVESYGEDRFLSARSRSALSRAADVYFFTTISLGGLGLAGFVLGPRDGRRLFALLALIALACVPLVFFGDARFHVPAMPLASICAAWLVMTAWRVARWRIRSRTSGT